MPETELARLAARNALDGVYYVSYLIRTKLAQPANYIRAPESTRALGGLGLAGSDLPALEVLDASHLLEVSEQVLSASSNEEA